LLPQEQNSSFIKAALVEQGHDFLMIVSTLDMEMADTFKDDCNKRQIKQLLLNHLG
jgi:hypothetical protein